MKHHTKDKGDKGVGFVIASLLSKSIQPFIPISEHQPFDLLAVYPDNSIKRVSVKYRCLSSKGSLEVSFKSVYSDSKGVHVKKTDKTQIDILAVYCPDTNQVYYLDPKKFGESVTLRVSKSKNGQIKGVYLAKNFMEP